ncbi:hypothetical protein D3C71_2084020 [compost metagenome]
MERDVHIVSLLLARLLVDESNGRARTPVTRSDQQFEQPSIGLTSLFGDHALDAQLAAFDLSQQMKIAPDGLKNRHNTGAENIVVVADVV